MAVKQTGKRRSNGKATQAQSSGQSPRALAKRLFQEMAVASAAIFGDTSDFNPDDLVVDRGDGVRVYQDMLKDPYVKAGLHFKKIAVARLPKMIVPASNSERDLEIAQFVEWNLENMMTSVGDMLWGVMDGVDVGYSISEINYKIIKKGRYTGKIGLHSVKSKDPYVYSFEIDDFGNILWVYQRIGFRARGNFQREMNLLGEEIRFPPDKFVIFSFMPKYSNPYGTSDLRAAYRAFFIKDFAWKFRAIYLEKFGMPPLIGRFPNGTSETRRQTLEDVLESIQTETVITMPEDLTVEILRIAQQGETEFERSIRDLNKEILIGILGSFLSAEEGRRTGARNMGQVHFNVASLFTFHLASSTEETVNRGLIRKIVDLNFDVDGMYPKWAFDMPDMDRQIQELQVDESLNKMGVRLDPEYFYRKYRRPSPEQTGLSFPVDEEFKESFIRLREMNLPENPKQIGQLKSSYANLAGMLGSKKADEIGYAMAGAERDFHKKDGHWMGEDAAFEKFKEYLD